ncbi:MAG: hypothetical protein K9G24_03465 [Candidatus Nanopelagicales bacterium]|nr:hypothetical protein [Candidatus Nanopelagicales bacterium]MCF8537447.1 hypothetical protein [Candidatus Nanopelagicales bacterium]MCF8542120.1 hypothetical protein [Candidatus Nanopelagicales bacterium]
MSQRQTVTRGALAVTIDGADLRDIRWAGMEVVRRIYPVFQDRNWTSRPFRITQHSITETDQAIALRAEGAGSFDAEHLRWSVEARISERDMDVRFTATTSAAFLRNRLGLCVLHPLSAAGAPCTVHHVDGSVTCAHLPEDISPTQPFLDIRSIAHEPAADMLVRISFEGDTFEMEDHRNWSDASFKTYCTPISRPFPVTVNPGDTIDQSLRVAITTTSDPDVPHHHGGHDIQVSPTTSRLPSLGVAISPSDLDSPQIAELAELSLAHLHVVIDPRSPEAITDVQRAAGAARSIGSRLHVATTCESPTDLGVFAALDHDSAATIERWYVFSASSKVTPDAWCSAARTALGELSADWMLTGGTDLYFTELNRETPSEGGFDAVNFSLNPQVHSFDDRTLIQNAATQRVIAENAARISRSVPICVCPITLRPRFNPNATDPESDVSNTPLPSDVDARQRSWFAACWAAMSLKYLSAPGTVGTATYFEAFGWKGIAAGAHPSPDPENFPFTPGERFPVWEVLSAVAGTCDAHETTASRPEEVDALVISSEDGHRALVANWTDTEQTVTFTGVVRAQIHVPPRSFTVHDLTPR